MQQEPVSIFKYEKLPVSLNLKELKKEGINWAERLCGDEWTDFNEHDPGVTILENVCYALTELSYKANLDIEELFFSDVETNNDYLYQHLFFPIHHIFTSQPINALDYRKLLIDRIPTVINAWVIPQTKSNALFDVKGLYRVFLQIENKAQEKDAVQQVKELLSENRNVGEDFEEPEILASVQVSIQAAIILSPDWVGETVLANILLKINDLFNPKVNFYTHEELHEKGVPYEEIFNGPLPTNGFILDEEIERSSIERINRLSRSAILQCVSEVEGVEFISNVSIFVDGVEYKSENIQLPSFSHAILDIDTILENNSISLYLNEIHYAIDNDLVRYSYESLSAKQKQQHKRYLDYTVNIRPSITNKETLGFYYSIQNTFPSVYGIGEYGVALKPTTAQVVAAAKQLKSYLMPYDQIMSNYTAQLVNVHRLLSVDKTLDRTYFSQKLNTVANIDEILDSPISKHFEKQDAIIKEHDNYLVRRNRILDHLLARFAEVFLSDAYQAIHREATSIHLEAFLEKNLLAKIDLLENYVDYSQKRSKGQNYRLAPSVNNVAGLCWRVALMFNFKLVGNKKLSDIEGILFKKESPSTGSGRKVVFHSNFQNIFGEILAYGISRNNYAIVSGSKRDENFIHFIHPKTKKEQVIFQSTSKENCSEVLEKLIEKLQVVDKQSEGFHFVEHILLRPRSKQSKLTLNSNNIILLESEPNSTLTQWAEQLKKYGTNKKNYAVEKTDKTFMLVLKTDANKPIGYMKDLLSKSMAESALQNTMAFLLEKLKKETSLDNYVTQSDFAKPGATLQEDVYSLDSTVVLPGWLGRFHHSNMRLIFEHIFRLYAPAHLSVDFIWLNLDEMKSFEKIYFNWQNVMQKDLKNEIDEVSYQLLTWLRSYKNPNDKKLRKELDSL